MTAGSMIRRITETTSTNDDARRPEYRHGDIVWAALPEDLQERVPEEFYINYSKEATLGQELKLWGFRDGQEYRMEGIGPQGTCFTALCVFANE